MIVKPFRGIRPRGEMATRIPSLPYDVVNTAEARELAGDDPHSFLHVVRPEIDLDPEIDPHDESVYQKGRENLHGLMETGAMARDERPAYYVYRLEMDGHVQTGILGAAAVDDYVEDRIKKHEFTRPDKEEDRVRLIDALSALPGPLFLTYKGLPELNAVVGGVTAGEPQVRFTAVDGIHHTFWVVDDPSTSAKIETLFGSVRCSYVADGHHRAAAATRVCTQRRAQLSDPTGDEACNYFLAAHFPADQLRVLDYNRVVTDLNGLTPDALVDRVRNAGFQIKADHRTKQPPHRQSFGMYVDGSWYLLTAGSEIASRGDVLDGLDVAILMRHVLDPILGIGDPRTDRRIDFVGGIRGMEELERRVDSGDCAVAFALYPTSIEEVMQVADAGKVMPPKSTWFEPKLRSGMVVQTLEGETL